MHLAEILAIVGSVRAPWVLHTIYVILPAGKLHNFELVETLTLFSVYNTSRSSYLAGRVLAVI